MRLLLYKQYNLDTETQKINWENSKIFSVITQIELFDLELPNTFFCLI